MKGTRARPPGAVRGIAAGAAALGMAAAIGLLVAILGAVPASGGDGGTEPAPRVPAMPESGHVAGDSIRPAPWDTAGPPPGPSRRESGSASSVGTETPESPAAPSSLGVAPGPGSPSSPSIPWSEMGAPSSSGIPSVPFGPGERFDYKVSVGLFGGVGHGSMEVVRVDTVRGFPCYHIRMKVKGGIPFAHVDDRLESWMDVSSLSSRRFEQDQNEPKWKRHKIWNFFPEQKSWATEEPSAVGVLPTDSPLDDASFIYYVRTLPLEIGRTYTLDRYFRADGNPVIIRIVRTEVISVPMGKFETIVVRPIIRTRGLFGQGGEAELYLTNDARRIPVMLRSKIPILGHLNLEIEKFTTGVPFTGGPADPIQEK